MQHKAHHPEQVYRTRLDSLIDHLDMQFDLHKALEAREVIRQYSLYFDRDLNEMDAKLAKAVRQYKAVEARLTREAIALRPTDRLMRERSSCFSPAHHGVIA